MRNAFAFPDPVNETSARVVAGGVVALALAFIVFREAWLLVAMVYGFAARVAAGPTLSPLGLLSTRLVTPVLEQRFGVRSRRVPGPPKRFAQAIGLVVSGGAAVAWIAGLPWLTVALVGALLVAASLEAFAAICLGCIAYAAIWECADCRDISDRLARAVEVAGSSAVDARPVTPDGGDDPADRFDREAMR